MITKDKIEVERLRDRAMILMLRVREVTWDMIEMHVPGGRDEVAQNFDKPFKALQEAITKL